MFELMLITDPDTRRGVVETTAEALRSAPPGRVAVQLRAKRWPDERLLETARALRRVTDDAGAQLLINTRADIARVIGADGVHLPENGPTVAEARAELGAGALVSVACHDAQGLTRAGEAGADLATLSPWAHVPGKAPALGPARFSSLASRATLPVFALGGIDPAAARQARAHGAHGVAVVRAVYDAPDPAAAVRALLC